MITNAQIKNIISLKEKKYRNISKTFVVEGRKMIEELLKSDYQIINIYALESWQKDSFSRINKYRQQDINNTIITVSEKELERISLLKTPDEVLAVVMQKTIKKIEIAHQLVLALDNINDPGNLGTIIRIAAWFGVNNIVCNNNTVDCYNPKVLQSTMGAIFHTNILYTDLYSFLCDSDSENIYGTVLQNGRSIYEENLTADGIIVIGNESHGISDKILSITNRPLSIPSYAPDGAIESLNASIACGIVLSEFKRR